MPSFSKGDVVLVRYPFSDLSGSKVRPAVVVSTGHTSRDVFLVPLTSRTAVLREGEFVLTNPHSAGLHVSTAVKRGLFTAEVSLLAKRLGSLDSHDAERLHASLRAWLGL